MLLRLLLLCAAELLAAVLSCSIFAFVSGLGPLNPLISFKGLNLTWPESVWMWVTGEHACNQTYTGLLAHTAAGCCSPGVAPQRTVGGHRARSRLRRSCCCRGCTACRHTGQPPRRLQASEDENIGDIMARVEQVEEERQKQANVNDDTLNQLAKKQEQKKGETRALKDTNSGGGRANV